MKETFNKISFLYRLGSVMLRSKGLMETARGFIDTLMKNSKVKHATIWRSDHEDESKNFYVSLPGRHQIVREGSLKKSEFSKLFDKQLVVASKRPIVQSGLPNGNYFYYLLDDFGLLEVLFEDGNHEEPQWVAEVMEALINRLQECSEHEETIEELQSWKRGRGDHSRLILEKYRRIVDNIQLGLMEVDNEDHIQYVNKPFCDLVGYEAGELIGQKAIDIFLDEEEKKKMIEQNRNRIAGKSTAYQIKLKNKEGEERWAVISGAPNYDIRGNKVGSIGIHMDVTDQKRLADEYAFQESKLRNLFEVSLDALISINQEGNIIEWNPQAEQIFGYSKKEVLGKSLSGLIIPVSFREAHQNGMKHYHETGKGPVLNQRIEITALKRDGTEFPIELTIFPIEYNGKHFFTAFVRDITELKQSREAMTSALKKQTELNNLKSQFVSMTSHELRTPLTTISTDMELLNHYVELANQVRIDKFKKILSRVDINLGRLNHLINNILLIGQLDSHKVPFLPVMTDVYALVEKQILNNYENRERSLKFELVGNPYDLMVDTKLFVQILDNLVSNAYKYSENRPPPEMKMNFKRDALHIDVRDHGIGIPDKEQAKMFSSFFRASNVGNVQGTGLGLSIVNEFVKLHGGSIEFKSEENMGTTFSLMFFRK